MVLAQGLTEVPVKLPAGAAAIQSLNWGLGSACRVAHHTALKSQTSFLPVRTSRSAQPDGCLVVLTTWRLTSPGLEIQESQAEAAVSALTRLQSHTWSFPQYSTGYMVNPGSCFGGGGVGVQTQGHEYQEMGTTGVHLEPDCHRGLLIPTGKSCSED